VFSKSVANHAKIPSLPLKTMFIIAIVIVVLMIFFSERRYYPESGKPKNRSMEVILANL